MAELTGFINAIPDGPVRVYSSDDPQRFTDVSPADVESYHRSGDALVARLRLKPGASLQEGTLDEASFAALFRHDRRPHEDSVLHRETSFKLCYSWNPPGGGGYC